MCDSFAKGTTFGDEELRALLLAWAEPEVQAELASITRNKPIFEKLAERLVAAGFRRRTGQACRDKINRVKASYRVERDTQRKSGAGKEEEPLWFEIMDSVLGTKPATCPVAIFDSGDLGGEQPAAALPPVSPEMPGPNPERDQALDDDPLDGELDDVVEVSQQDETDGSESTTGTSGENLPGTSVENLLSTSGENLPGKSVENLPGTSVENLPGTSGENLPGTSGENFVAGATTCEDSPSELESSIEDPKGKKGKKKVLKRKADTKTRLVAALQTSQNEVREDVREMEKRQRQADDDMEKRQRQADDEIMKRQDRVRDRQFERQMEIEERRRKEDQDLAREQRREAREMNMTLMAMLDRQTTMMARMMGEMQQPSFQHMNYNGPQHVPQYYAPQHNAPQQSRSQHGEVVNQQQPPTENGREYMDL